MKALAAVLLISTVLSLVACSTSGEGPTTGSLAVTIAGLPSGVDADVTVSGSQGYLEMLTVSATLESLTPGSYTVSANAVSSGGDVYSATVSGSPALVVADSTAAISVNYVKDDPDPDPEIPTIESISIQGYGGSHQVRQGAGAITVEVLGTNLADISMAKLGELNGSVSANNPISAVIDFTVPHSVDLGPVELSLTAAAGIASVADAVLLTAITAGPGGSDVTGRGTPDSPFRSLTFAVSQAAAGNTVALLDGTYSEANGEVWPVDINELTLMGESQAETIIEGPGHGSGQDGLNLRGASSVSHLTLTDFRVGLRAINGSLTLDAISSQEHEFDGLLTISSGGTLEGLTITSSSFAGNARDGIRAQFGVNDLTLAISDSSLNGNAEQGLFVGGSAHVTVVASSIDGNEGRGVVLSGSATLTLSQSTVNNNNADGILAQSSSELYLNEVAVGSNLLNGIDRAGTGRLEMRNSQVINNVADGVRIRNSPVVNLGDAHEAGNNTISAAFALGDLLADDRQANSVPKILAHGVQLGDLAPPPTGSQVGPGATNSPYWRISSAGNEIDFGP